jgi:hypothetical protein
MSDEPPRWSVMRLSVLLYPFVAGAAAINLFMAGLMGPVIGLPSLGPVGSLVAGAVAGVPLTVLAGRWIGRLLDEAA